ncbi:MAG: hypothetical protein LCH32_08040 [Bacteroidetes bacterium]|nr:hypothetical protein [Bacteroidota bacterium]
MAEETQYIANTGIATLSVANPNLDGTGTFAAVVTGASNGTLIKKVYIKAIGATTEGMVRLFLDNGTTKLLLHEVDVPAITNTGVAPSFEAELELNFTLKAGFIIQASTQNAETFNVIAEAMDWLYYAPAVRTDTTQFKTNWGFGKLAIANTNLNGTGTIYDIYTSGTAFSNGKGSSVKNIVITNISNVNDGMVRLYIKKAGVYYLFKEVIIATRTGSDITGTYHNLVDFEDDFELQLDVSISGSTQNAETYPMEVTINGNDWKYLA